MGARIFGSIVVIAILIGGCFLIFSTRFSSAPNQVGMHYKAGPLTSTQFASCIDPGTRVWNGPGDKHYAYPADKRTFVFSAGSLDGVRLDSPPITALTKDSIELQVSGVIDFTLNDDCDMLREFHERIGLKYEAYMDKDSLSQGWHDMLAVYLEQPLKRALDNATQQYGWAELYNNPATKADWENSVKENIPVYIKQSMNEDYFINFSVTIQKPGLPNDLLDALRETQVAIEQNNAQKERNTQIETELESITKLVALLGPDGYNVYEAIKSGQVDVLPIPQGSSVIMNSPGSVPVESVE